MCALCETFFTQESFRGCGPRRPTSWVVGTSLQRPAPTHSVKSFLYRRRHEKEQGSFSELSAKMIAGLRSPRPRLLSFHEESNQRRAKEEVSSLETPLRGKTAPLLSALSRFSVCGPENVQSPFSVLLRRKILPRELRKAKFSPPDCSGSGRMLGLSRATSGSR